MRKWGFVLSLAIVALTGMMIYSCSKENNLNQQEPPLKGAKVTALIAVSDDLTYPAEICAGKETALCVTFPQATKGNGDPKETAWQVQLKGDDPATAVTETDAWFQIAHGSGNTSGCFTYTFPAPGNYALRFKASQPGFTEKTLTVVNCCVESFTYADNHDGTYTFSYTPKEAVEDAALVFTFAQSAYQSGLPRAEGWAQPGAGQTMQTVMDLQACHTYTWTVALRANCSGNARQSNVWTDFKVNGVSKKNNPEDKFIQVCP